MLGIGVVWQINEHHAYGWTCPSRRSAVHRFEEGIEIISRLFTEDRVSFEGSTFTIREALFQPKPVQSPSPPSATGSPRMMRITAKWAQQWNTWGDPGLSPSSVSASPGRATPSGGTCRQCTPRRRRWSSSSTTTAPPSCAAKLTDRRARIGGPNEIVELIGRYAEMGVDELAIPTSTSGNDAAQRAEGWDCFADQVMSQLVELGVDRLGHRVGQEAAPELVE